ncbi:MAG: ABC transporter substrate-binding protein [Lentisphaerae bacterium]|nr:ABC transporter substrate-binding protein [Lentisphaerota bacterium]
MFAILLLYAGGCRPRAPATSGADSEVVYHGASTRIRGFDPVGAGDVASSLAISRIYEGLLQYAYLDRPYRLEPCLAEGWPEISPDRLIYTFRVRQGIHFQDDPCFTATGGQGRELTADDFVYSIKRVADLKNSSTGYWAFNNRIKGLDEFRAGTAGDDPTDYDQPVAGLHAPDRYTLRIELTRPYPQLLWIMAMHYAFAVPREAVDYYGREFVSHPVGTGPYILKSWRRNYRMEFERNRKWTETGRQEYHPSRGTPDDAERGLLADAGKPLPLTDRIVEYVVNDSSTMWLMFLGEQLASAGISRDNWDAVITGDRRLNDELARRGIVLHATPTLTTFYIGFNMDDPLLGANRKLRQALTCAFNSKQYEEFYNNRIMRAVSPIPPGIEGFADIATPYPFDPDLARRLLAEAGFPEGRDPDTGRRLTLTIDIGRANDPEARAATELLVDFMSRIGVALTPVYSSWPAFLERLSRRQVQLFQLGWVADYPDAENFLQLFYSHNHSPGPNHSNYRNEEYDELYERIGIMAGDDPERQALCRRMVEILIEDCPWIFTHHPMSYSLHHGWLKNFKPHDFPYGMGKYYNIGRH